MGNLAELKNEELREIDGGRSVIKRDLDGDGRWDIKLVYDRNGNLKRTVYRY